ncbi:MAG TPA: NAD(P)-dependent oxidoreductase [Pseudolysinimonas sp.]|jgi:phosphoglycerate dehydrogenase-like enzyme|nr:NAD(P)-dependent oxidoreductase [Pseudolysinimonas sp.]
MITRIVVFPRFEQVWPSVADHLRELLEPITEVRLERVAEGAEPSADPTAERLLWLGAPFTDDTLALFPAVQQVHANDGYRMTAETGALLDARGIRRLEHGSEGFWGQSVAEFALGLTISGLRGLAHGHRRVLADPEAWRFPAEQFSDDPRFTNGTVAGKRVRIVGAGNIASRYASFTSMLGADVAAWDPFASEPSFHRAGARREYDLARLARDAEIFVPMVPLLDSTRGMVSAEIVRALPTGALVVLATRAQICDMPELRRRVLADELALAADVFDIEPLPLDDPLLGRDNVVHTPHIAGRTADAGRAWARMLVEQLDEFVPGR